MSSTTLNSWLNCCRVCLCPEIYPDDAQVSIATLKEKRGPLDPINEPGKLEPTGHSYTLHGREARVHNAVYLTLFQCMASTGLSASFVGAAMSTDPTTIIVCSVIGSCGVVGVISSVSRHLMCTYCCADSTAQEPAR
jgi:hypothetical protein